MLTRRVRAAPPKCRLSAVGGCGRVLRVGVGESASLCAPSAGRQVRAARLAAVHGGGEGNSARPKHDFTPSLEGLQRPKVSDCSDERKRSSMSDERVISVMTL